MLPPHQYDAVYCSHNLEHYYRQDVPKVLAGFYHVLNMHGFVEVHVPDFVEAVRPLLEGRIDINHPLYKSPGGYISTNDVVYGSQVHIQRFGPWFEHKQAFTEKSLVVALNSAGFRYAYVGHDKESYDLFAFAFKKKPTDERLASVGIKL